MKDKDEAINTRKCYITFGIICIIHTFCNLIFKQLNKIFDANGTQKRSCLIETAPN